MLALLEHSLPGMLTTAATAQVARYVIDSRPCVCRAIVYRRTAADGTHGLGTKQHGHPAAQACKALPRFGEACVSGRKGSAQRSEGYRNKHTRDFEVAPPSQISLQRVINATTDVANSSALYRSP